MINWRFVNLNVAFREVVEEPSRTFLVYSDLVDSNIVGGQQHAMVREVEYRRQGKGVAYYEPLHIQWLPCRREYMDVVEVEVAESHEGLVKFGAGRTLITFVFKRDVQKRRVPRGKVSHHVGRQSDAVPSSTPAAAGWSRTSRGSVSFGRPHSGQRRASWRAGGSPRAVVAQGGAGRG